MVLLPHDGVCVSAPSLPEPLHPCCPPSPADWWYSVSRFVAKVGAEPEGGWLDAERHPGLGADLGADLLQGGSGLQAPPLLRPPVRATYIRFMR